MTVQARPATASSDAASASSTAPPTVPQRCGERSVDCRGTEGRGYVLGPFVVWSGHACWHHECLTMQDHCVYMLFSRRTAQEPHSEGIHEVIVPHAAIELQTFFEHASIFKTLVKIGRRFCSG